MHESQPVHGQATSALALSLVSPQTPAARPLTKKGWIWFVLGALITMGETTFYHSQQVMEFLSSQCRVQGNPLTLVKRCLAHRDQRHRF